MSYAGDLTPQEAWDFLAANPQAVLVDVRTPQEWAQIGVPVTEELGRDAAFVSWLGDGGVPNPAFVEDLKELGLEAGDERPIVFLCRSGQRSIAAALAATDAGLGPAYNILEGFEGGVDAFGNRGVGGWKTAGLAWKQS
ncbi:rhodanese-like domain-containing protein [Rarobacter faecitabidus]|uniref:Rhodanese-related sulfurtransferase n=1 Tax=Rarobacter faecitabidus TaxID=13243 RepID=A0A542ZE56_RARFA|nr:rhodanese-like domain-containing protein [Rarobacter faecitabidus]TQL58608.1 rhodanese-related sulfurtransferase [Rarobacter faecitabidus]